MTIESIDLADELRRIASDMDIAGSSPFGNYVCSKYDSDLLRDAAKEIERLKAWTRNPRILVDSADTLRNITDALARAADVEDIVQDIRG